MPPKYLQSFIKRPDRSQALKKKSLRSIKLNFTSLFILFFLFAFNVKASKSDKLFVAKDGIFDFSKDQNLNDGISLKGDWSFYWKDFLKPEDVQKEIIPRGEKRETHGVWLGDKSKGYATYLLKLKGLKPGNYILSNTYIYSSFTNTMTTR